MALVNNAENNITISATKHPTNTTNYKTKTTEIEEQDNILSKNIREESTT